MQKEKEFENEIRKYLTSKGIYHFKFWGGNFRTTHGSFIMTKKGVPDLICCVNGVFVGLEIKQEKGKPSKEQLDNLKHINQCGGLGFLVYPKDFKLLQICIEDLLSDNSKKDEIQQKFIKISKNF